MPRVYVSIGSNVNREENLRSAVRALRAAFGQLIVSPVYETRAVGFRGAHFLNLVVGFEVEVDLDQVIARLREIEDQHGRVRDDDRYGPRPLDLDVLLYGDLIDHTPPYNVPRGEIERYAFVLRPLSEIAGDVRHPETGMSFADMWRAFRGTRDGLWPVSFDWDEAA